jgi:hypothetical protein
MRALARAKVTVVFGTRRLPSREFEQVALLRLRDPKAESGIKMAGLFALDIRVNAQGRVTAVFGPLASSCDESASHAAPAFVRIHNESCDFSERFRLEGTMRVYV